MQSDVINRKLESLRHCLARLESKMPLTFDVLSTDYTVESMATSSR